MGIPSEWELWACANELLRQHGREAISYAEERTCALMLKRNGEAVVTWGLIKRWNYGASLLNGLRSFQLYGFSKLAP